MSYFTPFVSLRMYIVAWNFYGGLMKLLHSKYLGIRFFPWPVAGLWGYQLDYVRAVPSRFGVSVVPDPLRSGTASPQDRDRSRSSRATASWRWPVHRPVRVSFSISRLSPGDVCRPTSPGRVENTSYPAPTWPGNRCPCSCIVTGMHVTGMHHVSTFAAVILLHCGSGSSSGSANVGWLITATMTVTAAATMVAVATMQDGWWQW